MTTAVVVGAANAVCAADWARKRHARAVGTTVVVRGDGWRNRRFLPRYGSVEARRQALFLSSGHYIIWRTMMQGFL